MISLNRYDKIISIGDSLTFGYGISKNENWVSLLSKNVNLNIINKGINGDTSTGILSRFFKDILSNNPKVCIRMCGTNDILCGRKIDFVIDNFNIMIKDCLDNDIIPIILSPPKALKDLAKELWDSYIDYDDINSKLKLFSVVLERLCASNNVLFIDIYSAIPQNKAYYIDGIHLNKLGNNIIFNELRKALLISVI